MGIYKQIMDEISSFWQDGEETKREMYWFAWWNMCMSKKGGGMGFNLAMLAKQCWRLLQNSKSVCAQLLGAKYYLDSNILKAGPNNRSSYAW